MYRRQRGTDGSRRNQANLVLGPEEVRLRGGAGGGTGGGAGLERQCERKAQKAGAQATNSKRGEEAAGSQRDEVSPEGRVVAWEGD